MIFSSRNNRHHVKSFVLKVSSGALEKPIAFGPGSVVNGNVVVQVSKMQRVRQLKVVFQCTEHSGKHSNTIFSVASTLLGNGNRTQVTELPVGNHMYLFAIKLPDVNYPPTLRDNYIDHKVNYTLQGFLDMVSPEQEIQTQPVHIMYLPLVTCQLPSSPIQRKKIYQKEGQLVEIIAELMKPGYCPGDMCTIKMITQNQSDFKITHVDLTFMSTTASHMSTSQLEGFRRNHTLYSEKFYTAINKRTHDQHTLLQFKIPPSCAPSTQTHRHIDISYQIMITVPLYYTSSSSSSSSSSVASLMISLPVTIATVPYTGPLPPLLQIPLPSYQDSQDNRLASDMPSFLNQNVHDDSPLPSPRSAFSVEGTGSWSDPDRCSVSPMMEEAIDWPVPSLTLGPVVSNNNNLVPQDESGHLMVPGNMNRRRSVSSNASSVVNECSLEANASNPSSPFTKVN
ncbi:uncharacterized protein BX664DRAFT_386350 [Halteromyces radiatus]|uniref:uncharacterized protein n=1 Tax=Halteromyces radiatus TaxID=101107 RepID=UPI00221F29A3|nr:uncharacterized protein BX664DRAFT_386350 [Halteromyces radiatus]KAI8089950.1 hypothetical protein BX664DRAFT_386350 [Halteromyces radiatus]